MNCALPVTVLVVSALTAAFASVGVLPRLRLLCELATSSRRTTLLMTNGPFAPCLAET